MTAEATLVFMGMEITAAEAVDMLHDLAIIPVLVAGYSPQNANWSMIQKLSADFQRGLLAKMQEPGRRRVRCSTCGASRSDCAELPADQPGYALVANPLPPTAPTNEQTHREEATVASDAPGDAADSEASPPRAPLAG